LTEAQIEQMLVDSFKHAKSDLEQRALIEAKNEANEIYNASERALQRGSRLLEAGEAERIEAAMAALKSAMAGTDRTAIKKCKIALDEATRHLAEVLINATMEEALRDRNVSEILPKA
jgi:molecular chaperone DnaK (HSP70)